MASEAMRRSERATSDALEALRAAADKCRQASAALKQSGIVRTSGIARAIERSAEAATRGEREILEAFNKWR